MGGRHVNSDGLVSFGIIQPPHPSIKEFMTIGTVPFHRSSMIDSARVGEEQPEAVFIDKYTDHGHKIWTSLEMISRIGCCLSIRVGGGLLRVLLPSRLQVRPV